MELVFYVVQVSLKMRDHETKLDKVKRRPGWCCPHLACSVAIVGTYKVFMVIMT